MPVFILIEKATGRRVSLEVGAFTVGRDDACTLRIPSMQVSRLHARLNVESDWITLEDMGSTNGTFVNGTPVLGSVRLKNDSRLRFGDQDFTLSCIAKENIGVARKSDEKSGLVLGTMCSCPECCGELECRPCGGTGRSKVGGDCDFCLGTGTCAVCREFVEAVAPFAYLCGLDRFTEAEVSLLGVIDRFALELTTGTWKPASALLADGYLGSIAPLVSLMLDFRATSASEAEFAWQLSDLMWGVGYLYAIKGTATCAREAWAMTLRLDASHHGARTSLAALRS